MQESGFVHSAFTFVYESMLGRSNIRSSEKAIPPGALVSFLQKGLQYVGIEETLQREQQQLASSNKKGSSKITNSNDETGGTGGGESSNTADVMNLSLLSPTTIGAMTREAPPLQLNVPPATAAAAVRARLEAEAQMEADRKKAAILEVQEKAAQQPNGSSTGPGRLGPGSIPPQPSLEFTNPLANAALEVQAAQAAAAMNQYQQQQQHQAVLSSHQQQMNHQQQQQYDDPSAGAAARMAQQRRAVAEMAALEEQRQAQLVQQQLQLQQQLQQEQLLAHAAAAGHPMDAAALAAVADQMGNNTNGANASGPGGMLSGNKRPLSTKKGPKNKGKVAKQQRTEDDAAMARNAGFASLEEAVARLEQRQHQQQNDVTMTDASVGSAEENERQQLLRQLQESQHPAASSLLNKLSSGHPGELTSQQAAAVQDLMMMNGKHFNSNGPAEQQQETMIPPGGAAAVIAASNLPPKEAAKAADAIIDKEDELTDASPSEVLELKMHQSEVFMCAWNSIYTDMIATGSGDASARIWQMGGKKAADGLGPVRLLPHGSGPKDRKNKDVTTLEWSSDGKLLATGSYDGVARVWSLNGSLVHTLRGHKGPIFSLKWNKKGNYLLSGSYDKTTIVWNVSTNNGYIEQQFHDHQAPALDVDWKDDTTFASCSTDKTVNICRVGMPRPLKTYTGHTDEVNAVKWDPSGNLLASCSDDCTAKVWDVNSDRKDPLFDFKSHQQEIYTVKW